MLSSAAAASWVQTQLRLSAEYHVGVASRIGVAAVSPLVRQLLHERATFETTVQEWDTRKSASVPTTDELLHERDRFYLAQLTRQYR